MEGLFSVGCIYLCSSPSALWCQVLMAVGGGPSQLSCVRGVTSTGWCTSALLLLPLVSQAYGSHSGLHKGRLCLIAVLGCIWYFPAISSPSCFLLQASGLTTSSSSPGTSWWGWHAVPWSMAVPLCRSSSCFTAFSLQLLWQLPGTNGSLEKCSCRFPSCCWRQLL